MNNILANLKKPVLIVGIGNMMKSDDAAGPVFAENILGSGKKTEAINCGEVPENYLGKITRSKAKTVVLVDAVDMKGKPGEIRLFNSDKIEETGVSTHGISLALIAETIRQESGAEVVLLGIQPKSLKLGEGLSPEVETAVKNLISLID